jgi:hypothetical protein
VLSEVRRLPSESRGEDRWAFCEIRWQRAHRSGAFIAVRQGDAREEVAKSPKFRWRESGAAPPESPEIVTCLAALEDALAAAGWERIDEPGGEWCAREFRRALVPLSERMNAYAVAPDEDMLAWLNAQTGAPVTRDTEPAGDDSARVVAIREAARRRELKVLEAERREQERLDGDRLLARHQEFERLEAERREQERLEHERLAARRRENERLEAERLQSERLLLARLENERRERERLAAEEAARREAERLEAERVAAERREAERLERLEAERHEAERREAARAERAAAKHRETERVESRQREAEVVEPWSLANRLSAYTAKHDPQVEIRASFGAKAAPPRIRLWNRKQR